jgi:hypothetical protein
LLVSIEVGYVEILVLGRVVWRKIGWRGWRQRWVRRSNADDSRMQDVVRGLLEGVEYGAMKT